MPKTAHDVVHDTNFISEHDVYLFKEGNHFRLYEKLGAHAVTLNKTEGVHFAVWAPNAEKVSVMADFNDWNPDAHPLAARWDGSGIWEGFIPGVEQGALYKYDVASKYNMYRAAKADPFAFYAETPPGTASRVRDLNYAWGDGEWMKIRHARNALNAPVSVYEVHLGSWRRVPEEDCRPLTYREMASELAAYVRETGFTHVEFLPVMEHPFYGSWGYQVTGFFAPTSRYGAPQDFMHLVDTLHQNGIGVILDWVPSHFPSDEHGLAYFDGTHLYEHADPKKGFHPDWHSTIFNYGRHEVHAFLVSSLLFWLDKYHADAVRVDAVASMLYLDYSRKEGEWIPNMYGGRENLEALSFIRKFNEQAYANYPGTFTVAEESTAWPMVTRPAYAGGLGFGLKWNMGWMHDTLDYFTKDPLYRKFHHDGLTFSLWYAFFENFVLSLSHDEVVHGKGSLLAKMPGTSEQKVANLKLLFGAMFMHPGKKLLFMGSEFGQWNEWYHEESLQWHLLDYPAHRHIQKWVRDLNALYKNEPALYELDFDARGFEWVDRTDWESSVLSFLRKGKNTKDIFLAVCNFTPVERRGYRVGAPQDGFWKEALNSDAGDYGGSGAGNFGGLNTEPVPFHGRSHSLLTTLPPLSVVIFKKENARE